MTRFRSRYDHTGFTLIELLICILVIMILMAMLMPALGRVRYKAKLVVCMNNQKQKATSLLVYAANNVNRWPLREGAYGEDGAGNYSWPISWASSTLDDRPLISSIHPINDLQCPFVTPVDIEGSTASTWVVGTDIRLYGWQYRNRKRMKKVGDTMEFDGRETDVILGDFSIMFPDFNQAWSSHPDYGTGSMVTSFQSNNTHCLSFWKDVGSFARGPLDLNFTRSDGSTFMVNRVNYADDRLMRMAEDSTAPALNQRYYLVPDEDYSGK